MDYVSATPTITESRIANATDRSTVTPSDAKRSIHRMKRLARTMDSAFRIPFTNRRIGLDSLIGLIPGVGDVATTAVSAIIVREALSLGARKRTVARMLANIGLDTLLGTVPLVGDLFDFAFKANTKNVEILERELFKSEDVTIEPETMERSTYSDDTA